MPFSPVYLLEDEFAAELANQTVHAVLHIGWVRDPSGTHHGQMAGLTKPNGPLGAAYMILIRPFRLLVVYPSLLSDIGRAWRAPREPAMAAARRSPEVQATGDERR
jgi:hypothetical protein